MPQGCHRFVPPVSGCRFVDAARRLRICNRITNTVKADRCGRISEGDGAGAVEGNGERGGTITLV
jgi:hypothetical protein